MKPKSVISLSIFMLVVIILGIKAYQFGWFVSKPPLELSHQPTILYFNNDRGCECMLYVYKNAQSQMDHWKFAEQKGIPIISIHKERRADLASEYHVVRAPTLILLNSEGQMVWHQDEILSDDYPLDLDTLETQINNLQ